MPKIVVTIKAKLAWFVYEDHKSKYWIGVCDQLGMALQATSLGELTETIEESLNALFVDLVHSGELDMFLAKHGWQLGTPLPEPKRRGNVRFDVPYTLERKPRNDFAGALC